MVRKFNNKLLQADAKLEDDELFYNHAAEREQAADNAFDDNEEDITEDETSILNDEDMYESERDHRAEHGRDERRRVESGEKSSKGKTTKGADKVHDKDDEWRPANTLQAPPRRPGMVQRWIRYALSNENDPRNWTRAMREGWTPRPVESVPDGFDAPTMKHGSAGTVIAVGDLILCEMRVERFKSRRVYFRNKLARQLQAIERKPLAAAERLGGPGIKVTSKKSANFGRGRKAAATEE